MMMLQRWPALVTLMAALAVVLAAVNMVLFDRNRAAQADIQARAHYIQQTVGIETVNREIINAIANLSVQNNDAALRAILSEHGLSVNIGTPPAAGTAGAAAPDVKAHR